MGPVTSVNQNGTTDGNQEHSVSGKMLSGINCAVVNAKSTLNYTDGEDSPTSTPESCSKSGRYSGWG